MKNGLRVSILSVLFVFSQAGVFAAESLVPATTDLPPMLELPSAKQDPAEIVSHLVDAAERNLDSQKKLHDLFRQYQKKRDVFMNAADSSKHTQSLVTTAHQVLCIIQDYNMEALFDRELIEELNVFANIAVKNHWVES